MDLLSGHRYFLDLNSCKRSISFLSALAFWRDLNQRLPAMVVSFESLGVCASSTLGSSSTFAMADSLANEYD